MSARQAAQGKPTHGLQGPQAAPALEGCSPAIASDAGLWEVLRCCGSAPHPPHSWVGRGREGFFPTPALLPSTIYRFFLLVISPVQTDGCQGSGKSVGTEKGYTLRQRLCGLLCSPLRYIPFFPNSRPSPAASCEGEPCRTASHEHRLGTQPHGQVSQPDPGHASRRALGLSQGVKVERGSRTLPGN